MKHKMAHTVRKRFAAMAASHARNKMVLSRGLYAVAKYYAAAFEGRSYNPSHNGEAFLVARISKYLDVVFDVGANRGNWSALVLSSAPEARIHAFEIVPDVHADLAAANGDRCIVNDFGLSDKEEEIDVIFSASEDTRSRMIIDERMDKDFKTVKCSVKVGDEYCIERGVEAIDLLKIDVEGAEHRVLFGFKGMIERGKVACIQFEYNHARLHSRFLLSDFYAFLQHEYEIGRLSPQGVVFKDYELTDEDFCGPNYVAVRKDRPDLISAVAAGS